MKGPINDPTRRAVSKPVRKRRWWAISILLFLVALPIAHLGWMGYQRSQLNHLLQRHRELGEPVRPEDFNQVVETADENPADDLLAAARAVQKPSDSRSHDEFLSESHFPLTSQEIEDLRQLVAMNQVALRRAQDAAGKRGSADWHVHFVSPTFNTLMPELNGQRSLARLLRVAAFDAHQRCDDVQALDRVRQLLVQARALYRHPGFIVAHLVTVGVNDLAADLARELAPDLAIGPPGEGHRPASPRQVREIIDLLLDEQPLRDGQRLELLSERMFDVDTAEATVSGQINVMSASGSNVRGNPLLGYVLSPLIYQDARLMFDRQSKLAAIAQSPDWQTCNRQFQMLPQKSNYGMQHFFLLVLTPAVETAVRQDFRALTESRLTAVMLALRWYAVEHEGKLPTDLSELVPQYLPFVPADPMATAAPLRYKPDSKDPIIYSTGDDGIDDGGSTTPINPNRRRSDGGWER